MERGLKMSEYMSFTKEELIETIKNLGEQYRWGINKREREKKELIEKFIKENNIILGILNSRNRYMIDISRGLIEIMSETRDKINEFKKKWQQVLNKK